MMPVVRINDATFAHLKNIAIWFGTATPSDTIDRIVADAMAALSLEREDAQHAEPRPTETLRFDSAPGLAFTKPIAARVNGKRLRNPKWSSLLLAMIQEVQASGLEGERLVAELNVPAVLGVREGHGFKYHQRLGISVQGQSAADAWKEIDRLAKKWNIPVTVEFWWRHNPKAQHPGRTGELSSGPVVSR